MNEPMTRTKLQDIKSLATAATFGQWEWFGNTDMETIYLATVHGGRSVVMGFNRWGMQSACPSFQQDARMVPAYRSAKYEVRPVIGSHNRKAKGLYRADFIGLEHPDARFIAESRSAVPALVEALEACHEMMMRAIETTQQERDEYNNKALADMMVYLDQFGLTDRFGERLP